MRKIRTAIVGVLFFTVADARSQIFEQQVFQVSQIASAAALRTRQEFPASKMRKVALQEEAWHTVSSPTLNFTIEMPEVPEYIESENQASDGSLYMSHAYLVERPYPQDTILSIVVETIPLDVDVSNARSTLLRFTDNRKETVDGGEWVSINWMSYQGFNAVEAVGRSERRFERRIRWVLKGRQIFMIEYAGFIKGNTIRSKEADRFMNSLVIK